MFRDLQPVSRNIYNVKATAPPAAHPKRSGRGALAYLPLWLLMLAIAGMYWKTIGSRTMHAVAPRRAAASGPS